MRNSDSCKLSDPDAEGILKRNAESLDGLFALKTKRCVNCGWALDSERIVDYKIAFVGEVCSTCYAMNSSLTFMNTGLRNTNYFRNLHEAWLEEMKDFRNKRKKMGLDGDQNGIA